jgi:hypothetical protein
VVGSGVLSGFVVDLPFQREAIIEEEVGVVSHLVLGI